MLHSKLRKNLTNFPFPHAPITSNFFYWAKNERKNRYSVLAWLLCAAEENYAEDKILHAKGRFLLTNFLGIQDEKLEKLYAGALWANTGCLSMATKDHFLIINIDGKLQDLKAYSEKTKSSFKSALEENYRNLERWQEVKIYISIEEQEIQKNIEAQGWKFIAKNDFIQLLEKAQKVGENKSKALEEKSVNHKEEILEQFIVYLKNPKLHTPSRP